MPCAQKSLLLRAPFRLRQLQSKPSLGRFMNCPAVYEIVRPRLAAAEPTLIESELFGHAEGPRFHTEPTSRAPGAPSEGGFIGTPAPFPRRVKPEFSRL